MARTTTVLTSSWQQIASAECCVTVVNQGAVSFNQTASDTSALNILAEAGEQVVQDEAKATFAKGAGITVIVDTKG